MTGGSLENRGTGILSRSREISELKLDIDRLQVENKAVEQEISTYLTSITEINGKVSLIQKEMKDNELIVVRDQSHLAQIDQNIVKAEAKMNMLKDEKAQLARQETEAKLETGKYAAELLDIENGLSEARRVVAEFQEKHREDQSARNLLHTEITDYKISVNSIMESIQGVQESIDRIANERESYIKNISRKNSEKNKNLEEVEKLRDKNIGISVTIKGFEEERSGKTFEIDRMAEEKKVMEEELYDIINQTSEINRGILLLREETGRIEVKKAKMESEMEVMQNRMWEEYELTYTNALELKKDIGSIPQAQKKINDYRNQIKELGPVNVAAIEEYIKTKERHEFMTVQRDDMEQAVEKLKRVIYEMTSIMKKQFLEQFKLINSNFNEVFKELFEGGRAELILSDENNVLESGIEIEVQPPGKKLQNMMLLSGGERAFTAIALLFAILRLRPTPFCILDEIEAALDDSNVNKFSEYL
jgi:chromosome segregation protein